MYLIDMRLNINSIHVKFIHCQQSFSSLLVRDLLHCSWMLLISSILVLRIGSASLFCHFLGNFINIFPRLGTTVSCSLWSCHGNRHQGTYSVRRKYDLIIGFVCCAFCWLRVNVYTFRINSEHLFMSPFRTEVYYTRKEFPPLWVDSLWEWIWYAEKEIGSPKICLSCQNRRHSAKGTKSP